jgi:hypothetical protein
MINNKENWRKKKRSEIIKIKKEIIIYNKM